MRNEFEDPDDSTTEVDESTEVNNEETSTQEEELASLPQRFFGALIDCTIVALILIPILIAMGTLDIIVDAVKHKEPSDTGGFSSSIKKVFLATIIFYILNGLSLIRRGQTIGKKMMGTRIVLEQNNELANPVSIIGKRYLILQVALLLPYIQILFLVVDATFIFRPKRQRLSDQIAKTKVIKILPEI